MTYQYIPVAMISSHSLSDPRARLGIAFAPVLHEELIDEQAGLLSVA
jgi:hypothetical protein